MHEDDLASYEKVSDWEDWEGSVWRGGDGSGAKGKGVRRERYKTEEGVKCQGSKSDDAETLGLSNGNVPKFEDCKHKGG
jgi:hypothetical protein